jgi:hypothetical protein
MMLRVGPRFPTAALRVLLYPIIQFVVEEHNICGIMDNSEYEALSNARNEAEFSLLQKFRKLHKTSGTLRYMISYMIS